jgi:hypothetical protein
MAAGGEDTSGGSGDPPGVQPPTAHPISAESVSQAGAGGLLLGIGLVELVLGFWAAGWWQRGGALLLAVVGAALLARGIAAIVPAIQPHLRLARETTSAPVPHPR